MLGSIITLLSGPWMKMSCNWRSLFISHLVLTLLLYSYLYTALFCFVGLFVSVSDLASEFWYLKLLVTQRFLVLLLYIFHNSIKWCLVKTGQELISIQTKYWILKCELSLLSPAVEKDLSGRLLSEARCESCQGTAPALSVPNSNRDR